MNSISSSDSTQIGGNLLLTRRLGSCSTLCRTEFCDLRRDFLCFDNFFLRFLEYQNLESKRFQEHFGSEKNLVYHCIGIYSYGGE